MKNTLNSIKLGGLGANIGGEDWEKARKKKEIINQYDLKLKMQNQGKPPSRKLTEK
jgi:hypothetical protein